MVLNAFFEFLGPVVNELTYWGSKSGGYQRMKVNPKNQFFLVLDLRFGIPLWYTASFVHFPIIA